MISLTHEEAVTLADLIGVYIRHAPPDRVGPAYALSGVLRRSERFDIGVQHYRIIADALRHAGDDASLQSAVGKLMVLAEELTSSSVVIVIVIDMPLALFL